MKRAFRVYMVIYPPGTAQIAYLQIYVPSSSPDSIDLRGATEVKLHYGTFKYNQWGNPAPGVSQEAAAVPRGQRPQHFMSHRGARFKAIGCHCCLWSETKKFSDSRRKNYLTKYHITYSKGGDQLLLIEHVKVGAARIKVSYQAHDTIVKDQQCHRN